MEATALLAGLNCCSCMARAARDRRFDRAFPWYKAFRVGRLHRDHPELSCGTCLLAGRHPGRGRTGRTFDWSVARQPRRTARDVAGGARRQRAAVWPWRALRVDVTAVVESAGAKTALLREFIGCVRRP